MTQIAVIDYGMGNLHSVQKAFSRLNQPLRIVQRPNDLSSLDALILPGVGSFDPAMRQLIETDLIPYLKLWVSEDKPFLGICLGLQLMFESSEEGNIEGLNLLKGTVPKISDSVKVPHIGWNSVKFGKSHKIFEGIPDDSYFYFLHSYYFNCKNTDSVIGVTKYHKTKA